MAIIKQKYLIGNAKDVKSIIKRTKISAPQLIISSPPYFDLLNYGNRQQIGYGQKDYSDYLDVLAKVFQDCYEIADSNATFWLVIDTFKKNKEVKLLPFDIVNKLKEKYNNTWRLRDIIIWDKGKNLPWNNNGNFKNQHEYILFFTKGNNFKFKIDRLREILDLKKWWKTYPERYNPDGKAPSNIWNFTTPIRGWGDSKQNHLCPFPFPLVEKIISLTTDENDWVLDPFAGSGSVLGMAFEMKRNSIGIDINVRFKNRFEKEVVVGAKRYWEVREKEIEEAKGLLQDFKEINSKLRKLKVASRICEYINKVNKHSFIYFAKERPNNGIEIVVSQNGRTPQIELDNPDLLNLIKQSKVNHKIIIQKEVDFARNMKDVKLYRYKFEKFFSYNSLVKMKNIYDNSNKFEFIYSDIAVKVNS